MNWESSILNRIFRTNEFKFSLINPNIMKCKESHIDIINKFIKLFDINSLNIFVNKDGAMYKREDDHNTFYFSYNVNVYFYLYAKFFEIEEKFLNYSKFCFYCDNNFSENEKLNIGKNNANYLKNFLIKFLFSHEYCIENEKKLNYFYESLDRHFILNTYLIGNELTHYDVVLFSILYSIREKSSEFIDLFINQEKFESQIKENRQKFIHFHRWIIFFIKITELDIEKIDKVRQNHSKEYLFETFKLTSNQELVRLVMELQTKNKKDINILENEFHIKSCEVDSYSNKYQEIENLLLLGENVNSRETQTYKTLTHLACKKKDMDLLRLLIKYNADLEAIDYEFMTPVFEAVISGEIEICRFLIEEMNVNIEHKEIQDRTPFYWTACNGDVEILEYLIQKNVDFNITSKMGRTPLSKACWNGKKSVVEILVKLPNIEINKPDINGRYALHNAVWGENGGRMGKKVTGLTASDNPECAKLLIEHGAILEVRDNEGNTPLMIASSTNGVNSLIYLINKNANVNAVNKFGASGLIESCRYGNWETAKVLLENSKNLQIRIKDKADMSAIDYAVLLNRLECINVLLSKFQFVLTEYYDILFMSLFSKRLSTFDFIVKYLIENKILQQFSLENIFKLLEKMIIIHQYDKFLSFIYKLRDYKYLFHFEIEKLEYDLDLIILSFISLKVYKQMKEKTIYNSNQEFYTKNCDCDLDYDEYEDEIRERILNNIKNNEVYSSSNFKNRDIKMNDISNKFEDVGDSKFQNLEITQENSKNEDRENLILKNNFKEKQNFYLNSEKEKIIKFEEYIEKNVSFLTEKKILTIEDSLRNPVMDAQQNFENSPDSKFSLLTNKFIKLLICFKKKNELENIFELLEKKFYTWGIDCQEMFSLVNKNDYNFIDLITNDQISLFNKETNDKKKSPIIDFMNNIFYNSDLIVEKEKFKYLYSMNKKKKEGNNFENWKKFLRNFNNHNSLSLCVKNVYVEVNNVTSFEFLQRILKSKILTIFLFTKLKNKKNIMHLIFSKKSQLPVLDTILECLRENYPNYLNILMKMINNIDENNLTPIDIAIKKKNYEMVEECTYKINEFLNKFYFLAKEKSYYSFESEIKKNTNDDGNILYKVVNLRVTDNNHIIIPEEYKNYNKSLFNQIESNIKIINEKSLKLCDKKTKNFNQEESDKQDKLNNVNQLKMFLMSFKNDLFLNINDSIFKKIIGRTKKIIKDIEIKNISSHFNFNNNESFSKSSIIYETPSNIITNSNNSNFIWVDSSNVLMESFDYLNSHEYIGVDLEFHNYKSISSNIGIICVIQLSTTEKTFAFDSLKITKQEIQKYLKPIFESEKILKIFHGCDNDLNYLMTNFEIYTKNFIDTGRTFLVFEKIILNKSFKRCQLPSLNFLSKLFLNYELDKSYQKSDWRIRPLTKNMLLYALCDAKIVIYIFEIFLGLFLYLNLNILDLLFDDKDFINSMKGEFEIFYEDLVRKLKENKITDKETQITNKEEKKIFLNNLRYIHIMLEANNKTLEIIKQKMNNEFKKLEFEIL